MKRRWKTFAIIMLLAFLPAAQMPGAEPGSRITGFNGFQLGERLHDVIPVLDARNISYEKMTVAHHTFIDAETEKWKVRLVFNYLGFLYAIHVQVKLNDTHYAQLVSHLNEKYGSDETGDTKRGKGLQWKTGDRYSMTLHRDKDNMVYLYYIDHLFYSGTLEWKQPEKSSPYDVF